MTINAWRHNQRVLIAMMINRRVLLANNVATWYVALATTASLASRIRSATRRRGVPTNVTPRLNVAVTNDNDHLAANRAAAN